MYTFLFDFDGTLVDSMPVYAGTMLQILEENDIPYEKDIVKIITPLGVTATAQYFMKLGVPMTIEAMILRMKELLYDAYCYKIQAKSNVISVLHALKAKGARLNILTASPHVTLDPCLKRLEIYDLFDNVWSCDDFQTTKADPEIYRMAAARLGRQVDEILFLDDNCNADKTAKIAGMPVCGVYDASSAEYEEEMKEIADYYIYDFSELLELFPD